MEEETTATTKQHRSPTSTKTLTHSDSLPVEFWNSPFSNYDDAPSYSSYSLMVETTAHKRQQLLPAPVTHIPFDLVVEILCRLPVKYLLQFRCVCKSWNSLISKDQKFVKKQLLLSTKRKHLVTSAWTHRKELFVMSYSIDSIFTSETATQLDYSPINTDYYDHLIASCDGLICLAINKHLAVVWNPSIRKLKKLPSLELLPQQFGFTRYAFGYDPFIHNYKVVAVFCYDFKYDGVYTNGCKTQVKVHTLGIHSWRRIKDFPALFPHDQPGIVVNGTVNWLAYSNVVSGNFSSVIVSLDLEKECYEEIPQPNYGITNNLNLGMLRDCLCVFSHSSTFNDVWLMKEYGNKESWVKLIHVPYFGSFTKILYVSEDDSHVLLVFRQNDESRMVAYNSKNDTIKKFKIQDWSSVESTVYVESLISP